MNGVAKAATSGWTSWGQRYPRAILVVVTLACLLPFADKALHIDDPLFVWAGRHMQSRWWDPFGFEVNWYGWAMPMHEVTKNPPLACAYIALITSLFGESEFALHIGFLFQAIAVVLGTYALGRRLCDHPMCAALAALFTPVFMISGTTLMCDMLMVAFWIWAVVFWMRGLEEKRPLLLVLGALLVGACSLTKYFGIALIPLLLVYSLVRNGRPGWWLFYFLIPLAIIGLYEGAMHSLYGHGLIRDAFSYANQNEARGTGAIFFKAVTALAFTGGCYAIVLIFAPMVWRSKSWIAAGTTALFVLPVAWILAGTLTLAGGSQARMGITLLWTLLILGGLWVLALPFLEWKRQRSAEAILLLLWIWGTFAFCILNWTINGRSVLPMIPAVAILLLRRIKFAKQSSPVRWHWFFGTAAILSLLVCYADYRLANSARAAVTEIQSKFGHTSATIWFQGHWGFQYYAQENGFRPFDLSRSETHRNDLMVLPFNNTNLKAIPENTVERIAIIEIPVTSWMATMNRGMGAGFHMDILGPLPFSFGPVPAEKYYILRYK